MGKALAKVRQALRTLADIARHLNGCVIATDRRWKERCGKNAERGGIWSMTRAPPPTEGPPVPPSPSSSTLPPRGVPGVEAKRASRRRVVRSGESVAKQRRARGGDAGESRGRKREEKVYPQEASREQ